MPALTTNDWILFIICGFFALILILGRESGSHSNLAWWFGRDPQKGELTGSQWSFALLVAMAAYNNFPRFNAYWNGSFNPASAALAGVPLALAAIILCLDRLKRLRLTPALAALAALPFANLAFWLVLGCMSAPARITGEPAVPTQDNTDGYLPGIMTSILCSVIVGVLGVASAMASSGYGAALFLFIPFLIGLISAMIYSSKEHRSFGQCQGIMTTSMLLTGLLLICSAVEGIICILMAVPLALAVGFFGAMLAYFVQPKKSTTFNSKGMLFCLPILVPATIVMDNLTLPPPPVLTATTSIMVHAQPEAVRRAILRDGVLKPDQLLSLAGTNQLLAWRWQRKGNGIERICSYSLGQDIVQPVDESAADHIKFSVNAAPPPMRETSPFGAIKPMHIENHYVVHSGEFLLKPGPGGTQVTARTEYSHDIWPLEYWGLWSDFIMHRVHNNLLQRVKLLAENSR